MRGRATFTTVTSRTSMSWATSTIAMPYEDLRPVSGGDVRVVMARFPVPRNEVTYTGTEKGSGSSSTIRRVSPVSKGGWIVVPVTSTTDAVDAAAKPLRADAQRN